jgi:hypothetical protein
MHSKDAKNLIGAGTVKANLEKVQSDFQKKGEVAKRSDAGELVQAGSVQARRQSLTASKQSTTVKKTWDDASTLISSGRVKERMAKFKENLAASSSIQDSHAEDHKPKKSRESSASM